MSKGFYAKLALNNIKKNSRGYIPYLLTCIGTIIMFYNMCYLAVVKDIGHMSDSQSLRQMLFLGAIIIGIFSVIFLIYTNSFLIKQRKKEFGLFNILGMEKRHIAKIMIFETLFIAIVSFIIGILSGILLSKLIILLLFKILNYNVVFGFEVPITAVIATLLVFGSIFILNLVFNIIQVHRSKPIELLKGSDVGEKEPKTKWLLALAGGISLSIGYYLALSTDNAVAALNVFFIAVLFVMFGTHCLFNAGSIAILKALRKNKKYYYQTNHFISISGMIYRMKQNAAGLANICILSTAVIITLSTTVSLYVGMEDLLRTRYPRNIIVSASDISDETAFRMNHIIQNQIEKGNHSVENNIRYRPMSFITSQNGSSFTKMDENNFSYNDLALLGFTTLKDYNESENKNVTLKEGEALLYTIHGEVPSDKITLNNYELNIKERISAFAYEGETAATLSNSYLLVIDSLDTIKQIYSSLEGNTNMPELSYYYGFDVIGESEDEIELTTSIQNALSDLEIDISVEGAEINRSSFYTVYGGLFFLGLFIGLLFIMATVLIIYYKQVAEGFDDKERYEIMKKVGLSHKEIKQSIHSQVITVFFLPLVTAIIHIAFAFNVITELLSIFNLTNISLFAICIAITILVFVVFYIAVYFLTARTYYKIVS
ncbi:putative ABC transport system permease protein [Alkalibaculum bacchi]|uniref:Putative ABC transport system permease protein n=2 Tax=Alkalibaculum bacchi TaxID=645887 RepID=A0A366HZD8_9FIRM|nr:ABC transporter permease [Alkalibaculum bacchi]RBP59700.1 putative ABC transport system permease protein [Alkalibaculum bacchi]